MIRPEHPMRVLVVEDDRVDQMAYRRLSGAEEERFEFVICESLEKARDRLAGEHFDAVLVDYLLGDGTAFDLFPDLGSLPFIVITGTGDEAVAVSAMKAGASDYLIKDPDGNYLTTLPVMVEKAVRIRKEEAELEQYRAHLEDRVRERTTELENEIQERKRAEAELTRSLNEKEILLKEIHHRVKNNLQVISSLLSLQSRHIQDKAALDMFRVSQERVRSMALVHEKLYRSRDFSRIDFGDYIRTLADSISMAYGQYSRIRLNTEVEDIPFSVDTAVPMGLIVNELLTNAVKHAFTDSDAGQRIVDIGLVRSPDGWVELTVSDNGKGLPQGLDPHQCDSLGLKLVTLLVEDQLQGEVSCRNADGACFTVRFPETWKDPLT